MKIIRNKLFEKYTKNVITSDADYKELIRCQEIRLSKEVVDYVYRLIPKEKKDNSKK